jgi:Spy/CpxP family protein refolding chaperone
MKRAVIVIATLLVSGWLIASDLELPAGRWWENERLIERIALTSEQRQRINDLVYDHAHRMIDLNASLKRAELELARLVGLPDFAPDPVRAAFADFQRARQALERERFEMLLSVREVLTSEQWIQIQDIRRELRQRTWTSEEGSPRGRPPGDRFNRPPPARPTSQQYR